MDARMDQQSRDRTSVSDTYLSWPEVQPLFGGISRTTCWRGVRDGWLPAPVMISPGRRAWRASEVLEWQKQLQPRSARSATDRTTPDLELVTTKRGSNLPPYLRKWPPAPRRNRADLARG